MAEEEIGKEEEIWEEEEKPHKERSKRAFSFLLKSLNIVIAFILGVFLMFIISYFVAKNVKLTKYQQQENITIAPPPPPLATFSFPKEFKVNTADVEGQYFVKLDLQLAYDTKDISLAEELSSRQGQMTHIINIILGSKKREELVSLNQKIDLAEEIKIQLNLILSKGKIKEVYFIEFLLG